MTTHALALAQTQAAGFLYMEIEGLPYAFGTREVKDADAAAWFDVPGQSFLGVKPWLRAGADADLLPRISAQRVDFINSRVSIGALRIGIADMDGSLAAWTGGWRRDDFLRLAAVPELRTHATTPGTEETIKLRAGDGAFVAVGSRVLVAGEPDARRVTAVSGDDVTVSPELGSTPGVDVAVSVDRLVSRPGADAFTASGDVREGGTTAAWAGATQAFVGMETMTFGALGSDGEFASVTRGAYRSRIGEHLAAIAGDRPQTDRALVTKYPMQMRGRRVWLKWSLDATKDSETITVFAGTVDSLSWTDLGQTLVVECEDAQSWLRQPLFTDLGDRIPPGALVTADDRAAILTIPAAPDSARVLAVNGSALGVVVIRDGVYLVGASLQGQGGLRPASLVAGSSSRSEGAVPVSAAVITAVDGDPADGVIPYSHPLEIALAVLTSTGAGTNGAYDVLPAEWGLAIPEGDINVDEILRLVSEPGSPDCQIVITEPVREARGWLIDTLLKSFGYYLTVGVTHPITIASLRAPTPDEAADATAIGINDIVIEGGRILIEGPTMENTAIVGAIVAKFHPTLAGGKIEFAREARVQVVGAGDAGAWQSAPDVELTAWLGDRSEPGGLAKDGDVVGRLERLSANMLARFSAPPSILRVTCQMGLVGIAPGKLVLVTLPHLPNASRAARGMTGELFEVWSREVDLARGVVVLELAQTGIVLARTRYLAPACVVTGVDGTYASTKTIAVEQNDYTPGDGVDDVDAFEVGDAVRLYSDDLATRSGVTSIVSKTPTSVTLAAAVQIGGSDPSAGCHLQLADYSEVDDSARLTWAFKASGAGVLGSGDRPHVHS